MRDSAGIEIVENRVPAWAPDEIWTAAPQPELVIGGNDTSAGPDDSTHLVWSVTDVAPLSDGKVAVLSSQEQTVFLFEPSGEFVRSIGREGRGPGEFGYPEHLQILPGDTLVVWDFSFGPVTYFNPVGEVLRSWRADVGAVFAAVRKPNQMQIGPERVHLPMPDGSYIVLVGLIPGDFVPPSDVPYRVPVEFFRIDSAYGAHSLGRWEEREHLYSRGAYAGLPFSFGVQIVAGDGPRVVYISSSDQYEVHQFTSTGTLVRIVRRTVEPIPITAMDVEQWKDRVAPSPDWSTWDRAVAELPPRNFRPPVVGLLVDSEGYLWVKDREDPGSSEWSVFDPAGRWQGTLKVPVERLEWVGPKLILGVNRDPATGLEVVKGYRLSR